MFAATDARVLASCCMAVLLGCAAGPPPDRWAGYDAPSPEQVADSVRPKVRVAAPQAMRECAGRDCRSVGTLPAGEFVVLATSGEWVYVRHPTVDEGGWITNVTAIDSTLHAQATSSDVLYTVPNEETLTARSCPAPGCTKRGTVGPGALGVLEERDGWLRIVFIDDIEAWVDPRTGGTERRLRRLGITRIHDEFRKSETVEFRMRLPHDLTLHGMVTVARHGRDLTRDVTAWGVQGEAHGPLLTLISGSDRWRYLRCHSLVFLLDDESMPVESSHMGDVGRAGVAEAVYFRLPFSEFVRFSLANSIRGRLCRDEFQLTSNQIHALREFARETRIYDGVEAAHGVEK